MHKTVRIFIIIVLISAFTFTSYAVDLNELKDFKDEIQGKLEEKNEEFSKVEEELSKNLQEVQKLDESIERTENTLNELNQNISALEKEIKKIEKKLTKATKKYENQKDLLNQRLVAMYESGNTNYLDFVLGSDSISDFISSYYIISEITAYDMDLLETAQKEKNDIEEKKAIINTKKKKLDEEKKTEQITQTALSNIRILRENQVSKLSEEEKKIQVQIDEYNNQINEIENEIKSLALIVNFGEDYNGGPMKWPIEGHYNITSNYGMRTHPITGVYKLHTGVDISANIGTDFTAIANGIVVKAEFNNAYGNMVIIDHGGGVQTLYAHGSEIVATLGQEVNAGDVVLKVGSTGYSTGPHAHFEVRVQGNPVNPLDYVKIPEN